jgi:hypothetical protein
LVTAHHLADKARWLGIPLLDLQARRRESADPERPRLGLCGQSAPESELNEAALRSGKRASAAGGRFQIAEVPPSMASSTPLTKLEALRGWSIEHMSAVAAARVRFEKRAVQQSASAVTRS